jgi:outer membrane lipoprotein-sorting protein
MTKLRSLFFLFVVVLLLQSCVIEQNYIVNADKSGKYELMLDMSAVAAMSQDSSGGAGMTDDDLKKMTATFQKQLRASFELRLQRLLYHQKTQQ